MRFLLLVVLWLFAAATRADDFRPAYLEIRAVDAETYDVLWKVPAADGARLALHARLPSNAERIGETRAVFVGNAHLERWRVRQPGGLEGQVVAIDGLNKTSAEVLARVERGDGSAQVVRLMPGRTSFVVEASSGALDVAKTYLLLGVQHILLGIDHLLFVLALLIIVRGGRRIVLTITAFTVAHSITLVAATMGWLALPGAPVEAAIALSIAFLAREIVMSWRGSAGLTERIPWLVAFVFGLLHGLGFAGALAEIGLPANAIPTALLCFNVGVEIGQLLFVAAVLAIAWAARAWLSRMPGGPRVPRWVAPYAIGTVACFWMIERVAAFWA
jgi:hydrogenase/urease accessory protein HupE